MEESIKNFPKQFLWEPKIVNGPLRRPTSKLLVCGMGGSALAADLIGVRVWRDYGLPEVSKNTLVIASSYSGNTEETIDAFKTALSKNLPLTAISTGGKLLELARKHNVPYIQLPNTGIQPRMATGYMIKALLAIMCLSELSRHRRAGALMEEISRLPRRLNINTSRRSGKDLAKQLRNKTPIIYSSSKNFPTAYNWKIKFNETAKIPAFANAFPELNHNEMNGFNLSRLNLHKNFSFIFLEDSNDDTRILKRMKITKKLLEDRKFEVRSLRLEGQNKFHQIFQNLLIADWTAFYLAKYYGNDPEQVPMVEEFKKLIK